LLYDEILTTLPLMWHNYNKRKNSRGDDVLSQPHEDTIMKCIMELFKGDAVKFFGIEDKIISGTALSAEARNELTHIHIQRNIDDWLLETDKNSYLHFEFQSDYDVKDLPRFMVTDAILFNQKRKPIRTIVVYTADIKETETTFNAGSIQYKVEAFYMSTLDGDKTHADIKAKLNAGEQLTKQDLISIVFIPMMKSSEDKITQFEQAITLSREVTDETEQTQIQAMLQLLADKFVKDPEILHKLKEMMNMGTIAKMMRDDITKEVIEEYGIEVARKMLKEGYSIQSIQKITGFDESTIRNLQAEMDAA
jgi:hypothetical protein